MNKRLNLFILAGLIIALILNSLFVIDEKQDGIVFQFGEAINSDIPTGLNFKLPIIQNVKKYLFNQQNSLLLRVKVCQFIHML